MEHALRRHLICLFMFRSWIYGWFSEIHNPHVPHFPNTIVNLSHWVINKRYLTSHLRLKGRVANQNTTKGSLTITSEPIRLIGLFTHAHSYSLYSPKNPFVSTCSTPKNQCTEHKTESIRKIQRKSQPKPPKRLVIRARARDYLLLILSNFSCDICCCSNMIFVVSNAYTHTHRSYTLNSVDLKAARTEFRLRVVTGFLFNFFFVSGAKYWSSFFFFAVWCVR